MRKLVIHAPKGKAQQQDWPTFERTLDSAVGDGYAINENWIRELSPSWDDHGSPCSECGVVLLDKHQKLRAEGKLTRLVPTSKTGRGKQRYDVHMENLASVPYRPESLDRNGVTVIKCGGPTTD